MLDKTQMQELFDTLGVPAAGRTLVLTARKKAPVRDVQSRGGNVITIMASQKMGCVIRTESRHLEFAAATHLEFDDSVAEFYPQPCELNLELTDPATGEINQIRHVPDFLSIGNIGIGQAGITLIECKSQAKLQSLARRYPWRYVLGSDGQWFAPLLEQYFARLGIRYRLWTDNTLSPLKTENLLHLADYLLPGAEECPVSTLRAVHDALAEHGQMYVSELLAAPYSLSVDHLNKAIADKLLVTDLQTQSLTQPHRCKLFRDHTLMQYALSGDATRKLPAQERFSFELRAGGVLTYQGQRLTISLVGDKDVIFTSEDGSSRSLGLAWVMQALESGQVQMQSVAGNAQSLSHYTQTQLQQAFAHQQQMAMQNPQVCERTVRRWAKLQNDAVANGGSAALALVPRTNAKGNRTARLDEAQQQMLQDTIKTHWVTTEAKNYKACYRFMVDQCRALGIKPPSYPTLIAAIKAQETNRDVRTRHGKRMAYQQNIFIDTLCADTPQHGSRPFQYVHIDHTQLDLESVSSRTDKPLGRPWLTLAIDAFSRRVVSLYLTYEPPSYTSVMMCMRAMVQRYKRLPECIVVDNGKDLTSSAFATFLATMGTHLRLRPAGQPRHGAVLERQFGRLHSEYVHNLAGNTKATKNVRMTTGKHLPVNFAQWTLESLYLGLQHWAFEYYDQEVHCALDLSPRQAFERGLEQTGSRKHRIVLFNQDFMIATCPPVDRAGQRRVNGQRGVKVNDLLYWNPRFVEPRIAGQSLQVRCDPWDASSVYVWADNTWLRAQCRNLLSMGHRSESERMALSEEYRNRSGTKVTDALSAQRLQEFLQTFTPEGALALTMERHQENRLLYGKFELANVSEVIVPRKPGLAMSHAKASVVDAEPPVNQQSVNLTRLRPAPHLLQPADLQAPAKTGSPDAIDDQDPTDLFDTF